MEVNGWVNNKQSGGAGDISSYILCTPTKFPPPLGKKNKFKGFKSDT